MDVLLIRMSRAYNSINNTMLFDGKFASPHFFKALGESPLNTIHRRSRWICGWGIDQDILLSPIFFFSFAPGCDDLVNAVYDLAKSLSRLQMTDEDMALFSAAVLLSPGEIVSL